MSKRKGLSFDEKRERLIELFHETKDFFQLKELEKMAPKQKGIVSQSVKEVLESLVSDNLVVAEKIGTSNYFWSFPSTAMITRKKKLSDLEQEVEHLSKVVHDLNEKIQSSTIGREKGEDRHKWLEELEQLEQENANLDKELQKYADHDPALLEAKKKAAQVSKAAANRWTDNIFTLQSFCRNQFGISNEDFFQQFDIPSNFDLID